MTTMKWKMADKWIDADPVFCPEIGFLIEHSPQDRAATYELSDRPAHTNQSHEPKLVGWCGSYNNVSTNALGVWKVVKSLPNGRVKVALVTEKEELREYLESVGYPELMPNE